MSSKHSIQDLNKLYSDSEDADREVFSEMRSNVLLISGEHYNKKTSRYLSRIRDSKDITETQKLRLTKNHIHRIVRHYQSNILGFAPGVQILPHNESEMQDQKDAQLNQAVWQSAVQKQRINEKTREWCTDFTGIGEVAVKVFFDPNKGELKGYEPLYEEDEKGNVLVDDMGNPMPKLDEMGRPLNDEERPIFTGDFVFERIFGFNLLRPVEAKSMRDAEWLGCRKMVETSLLKKLYQDDEVKMKGISKSSEEEFVVFDSAKASYDKSKDQTLVKEYYFRPCYQYPEGYFYITCNDVILDEGALPYGIFPIVWQGFDEYPTAPRGRSIVKVARPYNAELNRASSQLATTQVTVGDDKIIYMSGTKLSPGALLPGVRGITYQGTPPQILPGRDGSQFAAYIESIVNEMYKVVDMEEENSERNQQAEPVSMLFMSLKNKKKFSTYGEKFEQFLQDVCELYLELCRYYLDDDALIYAVGKNEQINVPEFRKTTKLCYAIKTVPRTADSESMIGKYLTMQSILQYAGNTLGKDDVGKLIKNMPFVNGEESFSDLTIDYENAQNDMLAMERGQMPPASPYENHDYMLKKLTHRMKQSSFNFLDPQIQQLFQQRVKFHQDQLAKQAQAIQDAKNEFIPVGGALVGVDLFVPNPSDPSKQAKRARVPYQAIDWLVKQLEKQGMSLDKMEQMNQGALAEMAQSLMNKQNQMNPSEGPMPQGPRGPMPQGPMMGSRSGQASPLGAY